MNEIVDASNLLAVLVVAIAAVTWLAAESVVRRSAYHRSGAAQARALGPSVLRVLERIDTVVLDPIGTLTAGELSVVAVEPLDPAHDRNLRWFAGALQHNADDPVAKAIARLAGRGRVTDVQHVPGIGTTGSVDRHPVRVGRPDWIGVDAPADGWGRTVAVEVDGRAMGRITVADTIRPQAAPATAAMTEAGLRVVVLARTEATAEHLRTAVGTAVVRVADAGADPRDGLDDSASVAVVARRTSESMKFEAGDVALSDGNVEVPLMVEMADVGVHHVAAVLSLLRGAAARVRAVRRAVVVVTAVTVLALMISPGTVVDGIVTAAACAALGLAMWLPLARWR